MLIVVAVSLIIAVIRGGKLRVLGRAWPLLPLAAVEVCYIVLQVLVINKNYSVIRFTYPLQVSMTLSLLVPIFVYKLYKPTVVGAALSLGGTALNKLVIYANDGKMPVYPTFSRVTGYFTEDALAQDSLHCLMDDSTKLNFLGDYIDIGYSVMSVGDLMIKSFVAIIVYSTVMHLSRQEMRK